MYIFSNVKESEQCHKNAKRTAVVAKCFAKGKFVLLDSVLTSIHNKNLLSIKQKNKQHFTMILKLSLNWSYQTLITTEIDLPVAFVFGSFNHKYIIQVAFHANFADQAQKSTKLKSGTNFKYMPTSQRITVLVQLLLNINVKNPMNNTDVYNEASYAIFDILRNLTTVKKFGKEFCTNRHCSLCKVPISSQ